MMSSFLSNKNQDRKGYWLNELRSLGIHPKEGFSENEDSFNNSIEELANHAETIKQILYQEYKMTYSDRMAELQDESRDVIVI